MSTQNIILASLQITRLNKPIGIYLLLWPTVVALWMAAHGTPSLKNIIVFCLGVVLMRSAGCVINDWADRNYDGHVARTKSRPLPAKLMSPNQAMILFMGLLLMAFFLVLFTQSKHTLQFAFMGALLAIVYPFTKRWIYFPQAILGIAFAWSIPMAFSAQEADFSFSAGILFLSTAAWAMAYDTLYAMVDRDDDIKIGVKSTAVLFGKWDKAGVLFFHLLVLLGYTVIGVMESFGWLYYTGVVAAAAHALWQQWVIRDREPKACFKAFLSNHWFGAFLALGTVGQFL